MTTYNVTLFGIHFKINPVAFTLPIGKNGWDIYWYGIIIATGFLLAVLYAVRNAKRFNLNFDKLLDVVLVTAPVSILCARTYYVLFDGERLGSVSEFFGFGANSGFSGLAIYGGVIGAAVCGTLMCRLKKIKIFDALDLAAVGFLIGQGVGRWGNFTNQEAYGLPTGSTFWGMRSERTVREMGEGLVHPCFLYESIWCIIGFFILNKLSKKRKFSGEIALYYCVWYGFGRGFIELLRTDSLMIGAVKVSCLLSFLICIGAAIALVVLNKKISRKTAESDYKDVFVTGVGESEDVKEEKEDENE